MIYAVLFTDNESHSSVRQKKMSKHLEFLEQHASIISAAGPLTDTESDSPAGGLWLVTAESGQAVQALVEKDPFWPTGLRKSVRILAWKQVFVDGVRKI